MKVAKIIAIAMLLFLLGTVAVAQKMGGADSNYDPKTETTVSGVVEEVKQQAGPRGITGTHAVVKTENGVLDVHLGPSDFLSKQGLALAKGDSVEIVGSKVTMNGKEALIAREVKKSNKTFVLRSASGKPMWSGGRW